MHPQRTTRPDPIAGRLRDAILDQLIEPGAQVTETAVAVRFGVARPTAKLAIEQLVNEGLLEREAHRTARVPVMGPDDVDELFSARSLVECAAMAQLAVDGAIPAEALAAHRTMLAAASRDGDFARADIAFHRALVAAAPSRRLARLHALLMGEVELCIAQVQANNLLSATEVAAQHQAILDAVIAGDANEAERVTEAHIHGARDRLIAHATPDSDDTAVAQP